MKNPFVYDLFAFFPHFLLLSLLCSLIPPSVAQAEISGPAGLCLGVKFIPQGASFEKNFIAGFVCFSPAPKNPSLTTLNAKHVSDDPRAPGTLVRMAGNSYFAVMFRSGFSRCHLSPPFLSPWQPSPSSSHTASPHPPPLILLALTLLLLPF